MATLQARIAELARHPATAISLRDLYKAGNKPSRSMRLQNAIFLQRELPIRMAQRIVELQTLPFGLNHSPHILKVIGWYSSFVDTITSMPRVSSVHDEDRFTSTIDAQLQTPSLVTAMLSAAVSQSAASINDPSTDSRRQPATRTQRVDFMQKALDRFFTARIGLRFLMEHHVRICRVQEDQWSGIIQANFNPADVVRHAAEDARHLCEDEYGLAPEVEVRMADVEDEPSATRNNRLTYVPSHMHYICTELLKNAMRATTTRHRRAPGHDLPPIVVTIAFGKDTLGVRISDEGGGIALAEANRVWRYAYTTAPVPLIELDGSADAPPQTLRRSALAGYGMGLPLSRLYSQYLGGRLDLRSLEGHGTDCYLHLPRLGAACETLPAVVRASPAERDSTPGPGGLSSYSMKAELSEYEYAVLSEKLAEIRHD